MPKEPKPNFPILGKVPNQKLTEKELERIVKEIQRDGIMQSFILGAAPDAQNTIHMRFENISMRESLNIAIALFMNAIDIELKNHPEYKKEYAEIFLDCKKDLQNAVKRANTRVDKFAKK
jgi:hypothetical protein